jgi:hypothetical protein
VFEQIFATNAARKAGQAQNVKLMTIWFGTSYPTLIVANVLHPGANDAVRPGPAHYQHVPIPNYKAFLSKLISLVRSPTSAYYSPETKILLITPSPVADGLDYANSRRTWMGNEQIHGPIQPVHLNAVTKEYAKACVDVAEAEGVTVIDMHSAITEAAGGCSDEKLKAFLP